MIFGILAFLVFIGICRGDTITGECDVSGTGSGVIMLSQPEGGLVTLDFTGVTLPPDVARVVRAVTDNDPVSFCTSTGGHFNPPGEPTYGELSARYSTPPTGVISTNLTFSTTNTIAGRSLTFHKTGGDRVACCTIRVTGGLKPWASATPTYNKTTTSLFCNLSRMGQFVLTHMDAPAPELRMATEVFWDLSVTSPVTWHIHALEVIGTDCMTAGGHYNPPALGISNVVAKDGTLLGLGEMSNKHGIIDTTNAFSSVVDAGVWITPQCATQLLCDRLPSVYSVTPKSMVVHDATTGARLDCCNIEAAPSTAVLSLPETLAVNAECLFTSATSQEVSGYITFAQDAENNGVEIRGQLSFCYADQQAKNHTYHVHVVGDDQTCNAALGHYGGSALQDLWGPDANGHTFGSNTGYNFMEIGSTFFVDSTGDLAGKHGPVTLNGGIGPYNDGQVQLTGPYSVMGRSVVVHDGLSPPDSAGAARIACCTIQAAQYAAGDAGFSRTSVCPLYPVTHACYADSDCAGALICTGGGRDTAGVTGRCVNSPGSACTQDADCQYACVSNVCSDSPVPAPASSPAPTPASARALRLFD